MSLEQIKEKLPHLHQIVVERKSAVANLPQQKVQIAPFENAGEVAHA